MKPSPTSTSPITLRGTLTAIASGVAVALAMFVIATGYAGYFDPRQYPLAGPMCMAYPACLIANLVFIIPCFFIGRRLCAVGVVALLATLPSALEYSPLNLTHLKEPTLTPEQQRHSFSLMSFNVLNFWPVDGVRSDDGNNETIKYLCNSDVDILVLQEVMLFSNSEVPSSTITDSDIDSLYSHYPFRVVPIRENIIAGVFSKYPMDRVPLFKDKSDDRLGFAVKVYISDSITVTIANVHLESFGLSPEDKATYLELLKGDVEHENLVMARGQIYDKLADAFAQRAEQADQLRYFAMSKSSGDNLIITGDFNDVQGCWALRRLEEDTGLRSVYRQIGFGPRVTYYQNHFLFRIDHTLYRGNLTPIYYNVDQSFRKSDHFPTKTIFLVK